MFTRMDHKDKNTSNAPSVGDTENTISTSLGSEPNLHGKPFEPNQAASWEELFGTLGMNAYEKLHQDQESFHETISSLFPPKFNDQAARRRRCVWWVSFLDIAIMILKISCGALASTLRPC
jgi:hypothetical protein